MTKSDQSKMLHIQGKISSANNGSTRVLIPSLVFQAKSNEKMALTLVSFNCSNALYNIHKYNSVFYLVYNGNHYEMEMANGYCADGASLEDLIETAITNGVTKYGLNTISNPSAAFDDETGYMQISVTNTDTTNSVTFRTFHGKSGVLPTGVSLRGFTSDTWQILGGLPMENDTSEESFTSTTPNVSVSKLPVNLHTMQELYLRLNVGTNSYSTTGYDRNLAESERLVESHIFAILHRNFQANMLSFLDSNDCWQSFLSQQNLDVLELRLTDSQNRGLHDLMPHLADHFEYQAALRWDVFVTPERNVFHQPIDNLLHNRKRPMPPDHGLI